LTANPPPSAPATPARSSPRAAASSAADSAKTPKMKTPKMKTPKTKTLGEVMPATPLTKQDHFCLGCSFQTADTKSRGFLAGITNHFEYDTAAPKLRCISCGCYFCLECVKILHNKIHTGSQVYHRDCDDIIKGFQEFAESNGTIHPKNYLGSCCTIKENRNAIRETESNPTPGRKLKRTQLGGAFCIPEYNLLIPTDFLVMDVMALGKDDNLNGILHYVIPEEQALQLAEDRINPSTVRPEWFIEDRNVNVFMPHETKRSDARKKTKLNCRVFYIPKVKTVTEHIKGCNKIKPCDVPNTYLFDPKNNDKDDLPDVSILIGYDPEHTNSRGSILLCRFHTEKIATQSKEYAGLNLSTSPRKFLEQLEELLGNNGIEQIRSGGSSGLMSYNHDFMSMMHTHNVAPRNSKGVLYLRDSNNLQVHVFYIGNEDGRLKQYQYATPVKGGQFTMKPELLSQHKVLQHFIMVKPLTALLIQNLLKGGHKNPELSKDFAISPGAISHELTCHQKALSYVTENVTKNKDSDAGMTPKEKYYQFYTKMFKCTLVKHPVGRHLDTFPDGPSLENRICFSFPRQHGENCYGRGGAGIEHMTYCVLDWKAKKNKNKKSDIED
jgi:hypothetical protein